MSLTKTRALVAALFFLFALTALAAPDQRFDRDRRIGEGRIESVDHQRDGFRVHLDRGGDLWIPERLVRERAQDFRVGATLHVTGFFRNGIIIVDVIDWLTPPTFGDHDRRDDHMIRGRVVRIDYRNDLLFVRDQRSGRTIRADIGHCDRPNGFRRLDRGDWITLFGDWSREGEFSVDRMEFGGPQLFHQP